MASKTEFQAKQSYKQRLQNKVFNGPRTNTAARNAHVPVSDASDAAKRRRLVKPFQSDSPPTTSLPETDASPEGENKEGEKWAPNYERMLHVWVPYDEAKPHLARDAGLHWWKDDRVWCAPMSSMYHLSLPACAVHGTFIHAIGEDPTSLKAKGAVYRPLSKMYWIGMDNSELLPHRVIWLPKMKRSMIDQSEVLTSLRNFGVLKFSLFFRLWFTSQQLLEENKEMECGLLDATFK